MESPLEKIRRTVREETQKKILAIRKKKKQSATRLKRLQSLRELRAEQHEMMQSVKSFAELSRLVSFKNVFYRPCAGAFEDRILALSSPTADLKLRSSPKPALSKAALKPVSKSPAKAHPKTTHGTTHEIIPNPNPNPNVNEKAKAKAKAKAKIEPNGAEAEESQQLPDSVMHKRFASISKTVRCSEQRFVIPLAVQRLFRRGARSELPALRQQPVLDLVPLAQKIATTDNSSPHTTSEMSRLKLSVSSQILKYGIYYRHRGRKPEETHALDRLIEHCRQFERESVQDEGQFERSRSAMRRLFLHAQERTNTVAASE
jgi:hypothetical protein